MGLRETMADKSIEWLGATRHARAITRRVGVAEVVEVAASPLVISCSGDGPELRGVGPSGAARSPEPDRGADRRARLHLALHLEGRSFYRHDGADEEPHGDRAVILIDGAKPCVAAYPEGVRLIVWSLPRSLVEPYLPALPPAAALDGDAAEVVNAQATLLQHRAERLAPSFRRALLDQFGSLVGLAFACRGADALVARAGQAGRRRARVRNFLEARFRDPRLTATRAAHELGMSRRWLQAQFPAGSGFTAALAARRLEEAARLLRDPAAAHLTVTEIAFAVGFNDLSTFHRLFRRRFGASPGASRH